MDALISLHFLNRMISLQCRLVEHEKVGSGAGSKSKVDCLAVE